MAVASGPRDCSGAFVLSNYTNFLALIVTTPLSILLLYSSIRAIVFSGTLFRLVSDNRATVQFVVQLVAGIASSGQVLVACRLINFSVRRRLARGSSMRLDTLRAWLAVMVPRTEWGLPLGLSVPVALAVVMGMVLGALWAAAMTPVPASETKDVNVTIPRWDNVGLVHEYPSQVGREGGTMQNSKGIFTYSPGTRLLGNLLSEAATATPVDNSIRTHAKLDKSRYTYIGRSYGVGSAAGLVGADLLRNPLVMAYTFNETGYMAKTSCIYNRTSGFHLRHLKDWVYEARGPLPDSDNGDELSSYIGFYPDRIVAIGVAHFADIEGPGPLPPRRYLAFAAGSDYGFLDKVQCEVEFSPTVFRVAVNVAGQNITVEPVLQDATVPDIDPTRRLKGATMRQFELIANDQTNIYISTVGTAFNESIGDLRTSIESQGAERQLSEQEVVLKAVENSITVMADDILAAYASAQLMIGNLRGSTTASLSARAVAFGGPRFNIAAFAINTSLLLVVVVELIRTKAWRGLPDFDPADVRHLMVAASQGGRGLSNRVFGQRKDPGGVPIRYVRLEGRRFAVGVGSVEEGEQSASESDAAVKMKSIREEEAQGI